MSITYVRLLEVCAVIGTGLAAGGMAYITIVEAPARSKLSAADQLQHWRTTFPPAMALFKPTNIIMVPILIACSRLTGKSLYLGAALPFALIAPFTAIAMMPTNKKLLTCPSPVEDKEEEEVKDMIKSWARKHAVRVVLGVSGFVCSISKIIDLAIIPFRSSEIRKLLAFTVGMHSTSAAFIVKSSFRRRIRHEERVWNQGRTSFA